MKTQKFFLIFALAVLCKADPLRKEKLPHSRDYYAGYIKAITDNFDQLFPGERKARSTHDDEKERLFAELLSKNSQRGKVETLADIRHYKGDDSKSLMEMKRDVGSQEGYPDIEPDFQFKPHLHHHHHHHHRHKIAHVPLRLPEPKMIIPQVHLHHSLQSRLPIVKSKVETASQNKTQGLNKTENLKQNKGNASVNLNAGSVAAPSNTSKISKQNNAQSVAPSNTTVSKLSDITVSKISDKSNETTNSQLLTGDHKKHRKTAAHKKYILSRFLAPEETVPGPRREYILEHGDGASLPLYRGGILNYQDSNPPRAIGGDYEANENVDMRSPYDRGYGQFPGPYGGDMFGQFIPPPNQHPMGNSFMDSFGENMNMNNGMRFGGPPPDMQYSDFNGGFPPQRGRFVASLPTMSNMEKSVYTGAQPNNGFFPNNNEGNYPLFSPDNEGPQYPQFASSQSFAASPNTVAFNNGIGEDEDAEENQQVGPVGLPTDKNEYGARGTQYEDVKEDDRENETEIGETRSKIKKAKKESHKKKHKSLKRCGMFNVFHERNPTKTEQRLLTPTCNPDGSCTLVPSRPDGCVNTLPINPAMRQRQMGFQQVPLMPVLIPAPFGQPFPAAGYPQLTRMGNTVCRDCIFPTVRDLKFLIVPLINGRIFNGPPCNADLLSPYLG